MGFFVVFFFKNKIDPAAMYIKDFPFTGPTAFHKFLTTTTTAANDTQGTFPRSLIQVYTQASSKFNKINFVIHLQLFKLKDRFGVV